MLLNGYEVIESQLTATPQEANQGAIMTIESLDAFDRRRRLDPLPSRLWT